VAGSSYAHYSSRIADANRAWQAACETDVSNWTKTNEFILALVAYATSHGGESSAFKVQWGVGQNPTTWYDLEAATGAIRQGTATVLVNGNPIASGDKSGCHKETLEDTEEVEGDNTTEVLDTTAKDNCIEVQVAVDPSNGEDAETYSFRLFNITDSVTLAVAGASIRLYPNPLGESTANNATWYPFQGKCFYANGRFWVFYSDGTNMVYQTSTDGISWADPTTVRTCSAGYKFSVWFDGTYVHYVYSSEVDGDPLLYRRGTPQSDGSITWLDEQTAVVGAAGIRLYYPYVSVDSAEYVWIGYQGAEIGTYPYVTRSGNNDGTWGTTPAGFPYQLSTISEVWVVSVIPLTSQKVYALYARTGRMVKGQLYSDTSWGDEETVTTSDIRASIRFSAVNEGDHVHLVFLKETDFHILHVKRTYGVGWGSETTIQESTTTSVTPVLSIDTATGDLYCFWAGSPTADHVYYKKRHDTTWDTNPTDWIDESTDLLTGNDRLTCYYKAWGTYIGLMYMTSTSSPYTIEFSHLTMEVPPPPPPVENPLIGKPLISPTLIGKPKIR